MAGNDKDMEKYLEALKNAKLKKDTSSLSKKKNLTMEEARQILEEKRLIKEAVKRSRAGLDGIDPAEEAKEYVSEVKDVHSELTKSLKELNEGTVEPVKEEVVETETPELISPTQRYADVMRTHAEKAKENNPIKEDLQNSAAVMAEVRKNNADMWTRVQTALTSVGGGGLGERDVLKLIEENATNLSDSDLDYIASQIDDEFTDSAEVITLINEHVPQIVDSAYVNNLVDAGLADAFDSAEVIAVVIETVDSAYVNSLVDATQLDSSDYQAIADRIDDEFTDSAEVLALIGETVDSAYVNALVDAGLADAFDSDEVINLIHDTVSGDYITDRIGVPLDSADVQQVVNDSLTGLDTYDSAAVLAQITATVDSGYVNNLVDINTSLDSSDYDAIADRVSEDFLDSAEAVILINATVDSSYVQARIGDIDIDAFDSSEVEDLVSNTVDSAYVSGMGFIQQDAIDNTFANAPHVVPKDLTQTLGTPTKPWKELYLDGASIHLGSIKLTDDAGELKVVNDATDQVVKINLEDNTLDEIGDVTLDLANLDSDNFLMWDGSKWVNTPLDLSGLEFQQTVDLTTDTAPATPASGDLYINSTGGTVEASWTGIAGQTVDELQAVVWSGSSSQWYLTAALGTGSVTSIGSSTPSLKVDDTDASTPVLSISSASADSAGLMSAAHFTKLDSEIDSDINALQTLLTSQSDSDTNALSGRIDGVDSDVTALTTRVDGHDTEITALKSVDSAQNVRMDSIDSDFAAGLATKVSLTGSTMDGNLVIKTPHTLTVNTLGSVGNSNLNIKRYNDTKIQITSNENKNFQKMKFNQDYGVDSDLEVPHKKYVDEAIANSLDSSELADQVEANAADITLLKIEGAANTLFAANMIEEGVAPTGLNASVPISNAIHDAQNNRIIGWRGYKLDNYNNTGATSLAKTSQLAITNTTDMTDTTRGIINPKRVYDGDGNRYEVMTLSPPFKLGDDWIFTAGENPKDSPFYRLKPNNTFEPYGLNDAGYVDSADDPNNLPKICKGWAIINHRVRLDNNTEAGFEGGRYHLFVGNPVDRLDPSGGNGSAQAQTVVVLDVQDLIDGTEVEVYESNGRIYSCVGKSISGTRGGIPAVLRNPDGSPNIYLFQSGKPIAHVDIRNLATKDVALPSTGVTLPIGYLYDGIGDNNGGAGNRIAERGKINGLSIIDNRYVVFHALNIGIQSFDTADNTLTMLQATPNWVEYGTNRNKGDQHVPHILNGTFFFPTGQTGYDNTTDADIKAYRIGNDLGVTEVDIPYNEFSSPTFSFRTSEAIGPDTIGLSDANGKVVIFNPLVNSWEEVSDIGRVLGTFPYLDGTEIDRYYVPNVFNTAGTNSDPATDPYIPARYHKVTEGLATEVVEDTNFLQNSIIKEHDDFVKAGKAENGKVEVAFNMAHTNRSAIMTNRDAIDDITFPTLKNAGETEAYRYKGLLEHAHLMAPKETHPLYHIIDQQFVMFTRMFEGAKRTESNTGEIISDNKTLNSQRYGNDNTPNIMLYHIPTGKVKVWEDALVDKINIQNAPEPGKGYPAMRGTHMVPRQDGSLDCYMWVHNPRRTVETAAADTCPLYRFHIPASVDNSNPFANVTGGWTNIRCALSDLDTPTKNPYQVSGNNTSDTFAYQYEINWLTIEMVDSKTNKRHYFLQSYNKGSKDYVTLRMFEIRFDENDPDAGSIVPVGGHPDSDTIEPGSVVDGQAKIYVGGMPCIKKDIYDVERCFLFGTPMCLSELYFVDDGLGGRRPELRNYVDYSPENSTSPDGRVYHPTLVNGLGQPVIEEKGIYDNWYKSTALSFQALTDQPLDPNDELSNVFVWYQSAYGLCSLSISDLGNNSKRVRLENNFQGENLACLHIEMRQNIYNNYLQDFSSRNLVRFSSQQEDTRSFGSLWFFDYKSDYPYINIDTGQEIDKNAHKNLYNPTIVRDSNSNAISGTFYKRGIMEVRPNETLGRLEIHAIPVGQVQYPSLVEDRQENFTGECVVKVNDMFICSGATASHSSVKNPRVYVFNPAHRTVQRLSNESVHATSPVASRQHGAVFMSPYGRTAGDNVISFDSDEGTAIYSVDMMAVSNASTVRQRADTLRTMYSLTGNESLIATDPNTWSFDSATPPLSGTVDYGTDSDWDLSWQDSDE